MNLAKVNIPQWFELDELSVVSTIVSTETDTYGTLIVSDNFEQRKPYNPVIRLYLIQLENDLFEIKKELGSFSFISQSEANEFLTKLPTYSAIELIQNLHSRQVKMAL